MSEKEKAQEELKEAQNNLLKIEKLYLAMESKLREAQQKYVKAREKLGELEK